MKTASLGRQMGGFLVAFFVSVQCWAVGPAACPWFEPPSAQAGGSAWSKYSGGPYFPSPEAACQSFMASEYPGHNFTTFNVYANGWQGQCFAIWPGHNANSPYSHFTVTLYSGVYCPPGYTKSGSTCNLTDPSQVPCPPSNCVAGSYVGHAVYTGTQGSFYGNECYMGCQISPGNTVKLGVVTGSVVKYGADWYRTGSGCSSSADRWNEPINADMPPPINADAPPGSPDFFCVHGEIRGDWCTERFSPGCGTFNGKRFCASDFKKSDSTGCHYMGEKGYVCVGTWPGVAQPASGPPASPAPLTGASPTTEVLIGLPGDGVGTNPNGGPGEWNGMNPAEGGQYGGGMRFGDAPGGDGEGNEKPGTGGGTGSGSGNVNVTFDKSGLATEGTQSNILGKLGEIKDQLGEFGNGEGGLSTNFNGATSGEHDPIDKSAEIEALKAELQTTLDNIKTESGTLFDFTEGGGFSCPPDWAIEFNGHTFSLCPDWLIESLEPLGSAVLFMAAMLAAFIVLR